MSALVALREQVDTLMEENRQLRTLRLPAGELYLGLGLTRTERIVIAALMGANGAICSRDYLLTCLDADDIAPKSIDVAICRLRKKLNTLGFPNVIATEHFEGYRVPARDRDRLQMFFESEDKR